MQYAPNGESTSIPDGKGSFFDLSTQNNLMHDCKDDCEFQVEDASLGNVLLVVPAMPNTWDGKTH